MTDTRERRIGRAAWEAVHEHGAFRRDFPDAEYYEAVGAALLAVFEQAHAPTSDPLPDYFAPKPMPQQTFADRLSARSDFELGRMAGRDEIRAEQEERKKSGVWVEHAGHCNAEPQAEPSDAQVQRVREAVFAESQRERKHPDGRAGLYYPSIEAAETILRAAFKAGGEGR